MDKNAPVVLINADSSITEFVPIPSLQPTVIGAAFLYTSPKSINQREFSGCALRGMIAHVNSSFQLLTKQRDGHTSPLFPIGITSPLYHVYSGNGD